jgi:hypothetical protein
MTGKRMMIYIYTNVMMLKEKLIYQFKENNFDNKKETRKRNFD